MPSDRIPDDEMVRRGKGVLWGSLLLGVAGLCALFGFMYGPFDSVDERGLPVTRQDAIPIAAVGAVVTMALSGLAAYFFRPNVALILLAVITFVAGAANLLEVLPHL